ncbi:hypothetical protein BAMY6639_15500 [Bacillus amyloliquefaciens UMAF6639]|nr:hypothetical protein BAMY6639_15500 [Bacillus amyloliquefaciens UMAF6639]
MFRFSFFGLSYQEESGITIVLDIFHTIVNCIRKTATCDRMRLFPFSIQSLPIQHPDLLNGYSFQSSGCPELEPAMAGSPRHFCASLRCSLSSVTDVLSPEPFQENFRKINTLAG